MVIDVALPRAGAQPQEPVRLEAALPVVDHVGVDRQQRGDASRAEADLEQFNDPPAGLLLGGVFPIGPKADQQVFRAQGLLQALRMGVGSKGRPSCCSGGHGGAGACCGPVAMALQGLGGEVMLGEHPLDARGDRRDSDSSPGQSAPAHEQ